MENIEQVRTEVNGLEVKIVKDGVGYAAKFVLNGKVIADVPVTDWQAHRLAATFKLKNSPGQNFFDHVLATVEKSVNRQTTV